MIVVTANWEIGDGSLWPGPAAGIMERFRAEVARAAVRAGWQCDGRYEPVRRVDVVFAGDTFDGSPRANGSERPDRGNAAPEPGRSTRASWRGRSVPAGV